MYNHRWHNQQPVCISGEERLLNTSAPVGEVRAVDSSQAGLIADDRGHRAWLRE